jgi:flagellar hook-basal body complex protein FliE
VAVNPISSATSAATAVRLPQLPSLPELPAAPGASGVGAAGKDFGDMVAGALKDLQAAQAQADRLAVDAATGRLTDVHDYMIAATEASLATELTVAVRNKAVDAFNQIMQMGV